jgi:16S rRNA (guanine527-N7)-methyltransferase
MSEDIATTPEQRLAAGLAALQLSLSQTQSQQLLDYLELLCKWNRAYNLTAVRDPGQMVTRHLLDSLAIAPWITAQRYIDVGTGGGLPGVPLSILFPEREFHLLDSNGKKTRFLFQVKTALGLDNMVVHQSRVESFSAGEPFDGVLSRAFASLEDMLRGCRHLVTHGGQLLAMKGARPDREIEAVGAQCDVQVHPLDVPGLAEERHLLILTPRDGATQGTQQFTEQRTQKPGDTT